MLLSIMLTRQAVSHLVLSSIFAKISQEIFIPCQNHKQNISYGKQSRFQNNYEMHVHGYWQLGGTDVVI